MRRILLSGLALTAIAVAAVTSAVAQTSPGPVDRECAKQCRDDYRTCVGAAGHEARLCRQECADLIQAAKDTCANDSDSTECQAARDAAHDCMQECAKALQLALAECRDDLRHCLESCPKPPPPKDPACLKDCRLGLGSCLEKARETARECAAACRPRVVAAREACAAAPQSEECKAARQEAALCLRPCAEQLNTDTRKCNADAQNCVHACPDATPLPASISR